MRTIRLQALLSYNKPRPANNTLRVRRVPTELPQPRVIRVDDLEPVDRLRILAILRAEETDR